MDYWFVFLLVVLGAGTGFAAGLLGIGGGMLMVPLLTFLFSRQGFAEHLIVHVAIATSLATILFTSLSSVLAHHRRGAVLWKIALLFTPGLLIGSWIGPLIAYHMNTALLCVVFGVFVAYSALRMLIKKPPSVVKPLPDAAGMTVAGGLIGIIAGMVGAGGGFVSVPFMTGRSVPIHNAVATSAVLGFPIAFAGTLSNVYNGLNAADLPAGSLGFVYLPAMAAIAVASVFTAPLGARTAHALNVTQLKRVFACLLLLLATYMLYKGAQSAGLLA